MKSQIPISKSQINPNVQIPITKNLGLEFRKLEFEYYLEFGACNLRF